MLQSSIWSYLYPKSLSLRFLNCFPWRGLVNRSAIIIAVGQCVTSNSPESIYCFMKKYLSFICFVLSEHDLPLKAIRIVDVLSWYKCAFLISMPNDSWTEVRMPQAKWHQITLLALIPLSFCILSFASLISRELPLAREKSLFRCVIYHYSAFRDLHRRNILFLSRFP